MGPILDDNHFAPLIDLLRGSKCEMIDNPFGNPGDQLIAIGFRQLFARSGIELVHHGRPGKAFEPSAKADTLLFYGGGNVGNFYRASPGLRHSLKSITSHRKVLLPQSAFNQGEDLSQFDHIFAREIFSYRIMRQMGNCHLAPDGALALDPSLAFSDYDHLCSLPSTTDLGVFLRADQEKPSDRSLDHLMPINQGDPSSRDLGWFRQLPHRYRACITNRLHFGIWCLLLGRRVFFTANSYHKVLGIYNTWLQPHSRTPYKGLASFVDCRSL